MPQPAVHDVTLQCKASPLDCGPLAAVHGNLMHRPMLNTPCTVCGHPELNGQAAALYRYCRGAATHGSTTCRPPPPHCTKLKEHTEDRHRLHHCVPRIIFSIITAQALCRFTWQRRLPYSYVHARGCKLPCSSRQFSTCRYDHCHKRVT
jgi:hypothetical protein